MLGAPRSGTTLLADVLSLHPDVTVISEPRLVWRFGNDRRSDQLRAADATGRVVAHIHASFSTMLAERGLAERGLAERGLAERGGTRLVEKTPANAVRPRFVAAVFPDARFLHITRNGWGAVPSMRSFWERRSVGLDAKQVRKAQRRLREAQLSQLPHYAGELLRRVAPRRSGRSSLYGPRLAGLQAVVDELGHLEAAALQWRTCVEQTAAFGRSLGPDQFLELALETLDIGRLESALEFCGLAGSTPVLEDFSRRYDQRAATQQSALTPAEVEAVTPYIAPMNALLGYPPLPGDGLETPAPALPSP